jgi:hypothetical protein
MEDRHAARIHAHRYIAGAGRRHDVAETRATSTRTFSERAASNTLALADGNKATATWTGYNKENGELLAVADYESG